MCIAGVSLSLPMCRHAEMVDWVIAGGLGCDFPYIASDAQAVGRERGSYAALGVKESKGSRVRLHRPSIERHHRGSFVDDSFNTGMSALFAVAVFNKRIRRSLRNDALKDFERPPPAARGTG